MKALDAASQQLRTAVPHARQFESRRTTEVGKRPLKNARLSAPAGCRGDGRRVPGGSGIGALEHFPHFTSALSRKREERERVA